MCHIDLTSRFAFMPPVRNFGYYSSFVFLYYTTCFGLIGHLQVYRLLWSRNLLLTVMKLQQTLQWAADSLIIETCVIVGSRFLNHNNLCYFTFMECILLCVTITRKFLFTVNTTNIFHVYITLLLHVSVSWDHHQVNSWNYTKIIRFLFYQ
jgi:hypothetical protein